MQCALLRLPDERFHLYSEMPTVLISLKIDLI